MSDLVRYKCRLCGWRKKALVGGGLSFYFEMRACFSCADIFPYRRPYPGSRHPEPSLACPLCRDITDDWCSHTREDLAEERDLFRRITCPACMRKTVHGKTVSMLHPVYLTSA